MRFSFGFRVTVFYPGFKLEANILAWRRNADFNHERHESHEIVNCKEP